MEGSNPVSLDQEHQPDEFATSLRRKLKNLSPLPSRCCIYRVPERLRHDNARAYTPKVVSIGPLHRGAEGLKAMEKHKMLCLKSFLKRTKLSMEDYVEFMKEREQKVRNHYDEDFEQMGSDQFVETILVDSASVVEILWRNHSKEAARENDRIFNKPWKIMDIRHDMMLLENQLPFFLFEYIFDLAKLKVLRDNVSDSDCPSIEKRSLIKLTYEFFKFKAYLGDIGEILSRINSSKIKHFVDFFRKCHVPRPFAKKAGCGKKGEEKKSKEGELPRVFMLNDDVNGARLGRKINLIKETASSGGNWLVFWKPDFEALRGRIWKNKVECCSVLTGSSSVSDTANKVGLDYGLSWKWTGRPNHSIVAHPVTFDVYAVGKQPTGSM
ncbi:hypothetical protein TIFTF001_033851 [Ficus carica]|uniref:Uncharacterized protein n=1 Tax=Ficus carica TaxID=3494 RepID=A0AA88DZH9_FICCA|nr:hypothetical protein TIFTF001_033851 [Ficus carica]